MSQVFPPNSNKVLYILQNVLFLSY